MATIRNPNPFSLYSVALGRSVAGEEIVDGLTDEVADAACASGVLERGILVRPEAEPEENVEEKPKRPVGRPSSKRGSVIVEEVVENERETR